MLLDMTASVSGWNSAPYPVVLLGVPLRAEGVEGLAPLGAVGELEEAGERAPVLGRVREDGVLEVDAVGEDVVVLVHPVEETNRKTVRREQGLLACAGAEFFNIFLQVNRKVQLSDR